MPVQSLSTHARASLVYLLLPSRSTCFASRCQTDTLCSLLPTHTACRGEGVAAGGVPGGRASGPLPSPRPTAPLRLPFSAAPPTSSHYADIHSQTKIKQNNRKNNKNKNSKDSLRKFMKLCILYVCQTFSRHSKMAVMSITHEKKKLQCYTLTNTLSQLRFFVFYLFILEKIHKKHRLC